MGTSFDVLVNFAKRTGRIDRLFWMESHELAPEDMFDREQVAFLKEVDALCEFAVLRMRVICESRDYWPTTHEKNLLVYEYLLELYLGRLLEIISKEIEESDPDYEAVVKAPMTDMIRDLL